MNPGDKLLVTGLMIPHLHRNLHEAVQTGVGVPPPTWKKFPAHNETSSGSCTAIQGDDEAVAENRGVCRSTEVHPTPSVRTTLSHTMTRFRNTSDSNRPRILSLHPQVRLRTDRSH
jgi:hypothetical protein